MNRLSLYWTLALVCCVGNGCRVASLSAPRAPADVSLATATMVEREDDLPLGTSVYVVRHGWHTGLVLPRVARMPDAWPDAEQFDAHEFVEIGWGDAAFYQASWPWPWVVLPAAAWPTTSTLHVTGFSQPVETFFSQSQVVEIPLSLSQCRDLCRFIADSCARDAWGRAEVLQTARYGGGCFFRGSERYVVPKTCNTWTARALASAGIDIQPAYCTLAHGVLWQLRGCGHQTHAATNVLPVLYPFFGFREPS